MKSTLVLGTALAAALFSAPAFAQDQPTTAVGGPGESCRARSDCKAGLKCVNQACADEHEGQDCAATADCGGELKCISKKCTSGSSPVYSNPNADKDHRGGGAREWLAFRLQGAHPFVGLTWAGGFDTGGSTGNLSTGFNTFNGAFLFGINGGVFFDNHQLMVELSPFTYVFDGRARGPAFQFNGSYAYFIPLYDSETIQVYWPLRVGVGMMAGADNNTSNLAFFQARGDVIGVGLKIGHVMLDMHLPSFRYQVTDRAGFQGHLLDWLFGLSASYVF